MVNIFNFYKPKRKKENTLRLSTLMWNYFQEVLMNHFRFSALGHTSKKKVSFRKQISVSFGLPPLNFMTCAHETPYNDSLVSKAKSITVKNSGKSPLEIDRKWNSWKQKWLHRLLFSISGRKAKSSLVNSNNRFRSCGPTRPSLAMAAAMFKTTLWPSLGGERNGVKVLHIEILQKGR